jgi:hypothetical protein
MQVLTRPTLTRRTAPPLQARRGQSPVDHVIAVIGWPTNRACPRTPANNAGRPAGIWRPSSPPWCVVKTGVLFFRRTGSLCDSSTTSSRCTLSFRRSLRDVSDKGSRRPSRGRGGWSGAWRRRCGPSTLRTPSRGPSCGPSTWATTPTPRGRSAGSWPGRFGASRTSQGRCAQVWHGRTCWRSPWRASSWSGPAQRLSVRAAVVGADHDRDEFAPGLLGDLLALRSEVVLVVAPPR